MPYRSERSLLTLVIAAAWVVGVDGIADAATPTPSMDSPQSAAAGTLGAILPLSMLDSASSPDDLPIWTGARPGGEGLGNVPLPTFADSTLLSDAALDVGLDPAVLTGDRGLAGDGVTAAYSMTAVTDPSGDARRLVSAALDAAFPSRMPPVDWDTLTVDGREVLVLGDGRNYLYATGPWAFQVSLLTGEDRTPMAAFLTRLPPDDSAPPPAPPTTAVELGARLGRLRTEPPLAWSGNALVPRSGYPSKPSDIHRYRRMGRTGP